MFMACRDKKALAQQVEKLQESLSQLEQQHAQQLTAKDAAHLQQLQQIRTELERRQLDWVSHKCQVCRASVSSLHCGSGWGEVSISSCSLWEVLH